MDCVKPNETGHCKTADAPGLLVSQHFGRTSNDTNQALSQSHYSTDKPILTRRPVMVIGTLSQMSGASMRAVQATSTAVVYQTELYEAIEQIAIDPSGWSLVVVCGNELEGEENARRAAGFIKTAAPFLRIIVDESNSTDFGEIKSSCSLIQDGTAVGII